MRRCIGLPPRLSLSQPLSRTVQVHARLRLATNPDRHPVSRVGREDPVGLIPSMEISGNRARGVATLLGPPQVLLGDDVADHAVHPVDAAIVNGLEQSLPVLIGEPPGGQPELAVGKADLIQFRHLGRGAEKAICAPGHALVAGAPALIVGPGPQDVDRFAEGFQNGNLISGDQFHPAGHARTHFNPVTGRPAPSD